MRRIQYFLLIACVVAGSVGASSSKPHGIPEILRGLRIHGFTGVLAGDRFPASESIARKIPHTGHSHNDYEQPHPLNDALAARFPSVEADIWLRGGQLRVSHYGLFFAGSLKDLYLDPIQKRVDELGSVYGDGRPFVLWLDIKSGGPEMARAIQEGLAGYSRMLTQYSSKGVQAGPVTVILTGDGDVKSAYIRDNPERFAARDSNEYGEADPPTDGAWLWYSLYWPSHFSWDGVGLMPDDERKNLQALVAKIHANGRKLRFWGGPDTPEVWEASYEAGVDLIGTDSLAELSGYFTWRGPTLAENNPAPRR